MTESHKVLADYVQNGSEPAFRELLTRYVDLVYSAAVRLVDGDADLAQDVAQTVFVDLAKEARTLPENVMLGGWLHRHTCFVASNTMRRERRRQARERQAVEMSALQDHSDSDLAQISPVLDQAINKLGTEDRTTIMLRFFEQSDFRSVGEALGSTEEAARKRVNRALEKLHNLLKARGVTLSATALGTVLAAGAVKAAPVGLAASLSAAALASTAVGTGTTLTLLKVMTASKLSFGIASTVVVAGIALSAIQHQSLVKLRDENSSLRQQAEEVTAETQRLANLLADANSSQAAASNQLSELLRLRGEVGVLRRQLTDAAKVVPERNANAPQAQAAVDPEAQLQQMAFAKMRNAKIWTFALSRYADKHGGQFATSFDQAARHLDEALLGDLNPGEVLRDKTEFVQSSNEFEIVYQGSFKDITNPSSVIVMREKDAWTTPAGAWIRTYAFADGHTEVHKADDGNFAPWENEHSQNPVGQ